MGGSDEEVWPEWPVAPGTQVQRIVDVQVACSPEELFLLLWGPNSAFVAKSQEVLGNKDYTETCWVASEADLVAGNKGTPPTEPLKPAQYKGMRRKNKCSSQGMGLKYTNDEMQRCNEAAEGGPFEVDVVVHTTATYGDRFRPILRHRIVKAGPSKSNYTVDYALVYIANTNGFLKKAIERGASNGISKNFKIMVEILGTFKTVGDEEPSAAAAPAVPEAPANGISAAAPRMDLGARVPEYVLPWWSPLLGVESVKLMELPASWIRSKTGIGGTAISQEQGSHIATGLAAAAVLLVLAVLLSALQGLHASCQQSPGLAASVCAGLLGWLHLPETLRQVLCGGGLLLLANALSATASARLRAFLEQRQAVRAHRTSSNRASETGDDTASGIRYDGYEQSLESAAAHIAEGEGDLKKRALLSGSIGSGKHRQRFRANLKVGLKNLIDHTTPRWTSKKEDAAKEPPKDASNRGASPATSLTGGSSPPAPPSAFAGGADREEEDECAEAAKRPVESTSRRSLQSANSDSSSIILTDEEEGRPQAGSLQKRPSAGGGGGGGGFRDYMNPGGLLGKTEVMFAQWSGSNKQPKTGASALDIPSRPSGAKADYEAQEEAGSMVSSGPAVMELANLSAKDPEETGEPVQEEVFENERYQPFRGWGHQWPGHFLPTDRVGHWSTQASAQQANLDSASFDAIAPKLKQDWEWVEEGWQIDMTGLLENAVDEEGWTYAVDFAWITWPPGPGSGRFRKVRDYVRRRRWFRTRRSCGIPMQESPSRQLQPAVAASASTPSMTSLLTEALTRTSPDKDSLEKGLVQGALPPRPRLKAERLRPAELATPRESSPDLMSVSAPAANAPTATAAAQQAAASQVEGSAHSARSDGGHVGLGASMAGGAAASAPSKERQAVQLLKRPSPGFRERHRDKGREKTAVKEKEGEVDVEKDASKRGFANKMSGMLAAASSSLRSGPAKKERGSAVRLPSERKPVLVRESAPVVTGSSHLKPDRRSTSDLVEPSAGVADLATYFGIPPADTPSTAVEPADVDIKPVSQTTSTARATQANGSRTAGALPALEQPAAAESWEGADLRGAAASSDPPVAAAPTAMAAMLPSSQSAAPVTASASLEQSRQSAASIAGRAAQASTLSAPATPGLPLTPPSLALGPAAEAAHGAAGAPADTDTDRVSGQQAWPAAGASSASAPGDGGEPRDSPQPAATRSDGRADSGSVETAAADHVIRAGAPQGAALDAPSLEPHAQPATAEQVADPEGQAGSGQDRALQADEHSTPIANEEVGSERIARATSREQSLERKPAEARADPSGPVSQPSGTAAKRSPFAKAADHDEAGADRFEELAAHTAGSDPLARRRISQSVPAASGAAAAAAESSMLPKALSADEASLVIQQAREAAEQVQRELQALLPLVNIPKKRNGFGHQQSPGQQ